MVKGIQHVSLHLCHRHVSFCTLSPTPKTVETLKPSSPKYAHEAMFFGHNAVARAKHQLSAGKRWQALSREVILQSS